MRSWEVIRTDCSSSDWMTDIQQRKESETLHFSGSHTLSLPYLLVFTWKEREQHVAVISPSCQRAANRGLIYIRGLQERLSQQRLKYQRHNDRSAWWPMAARCFLVYRSIHPRQRDTKSHALTHTLQHNAYLGSPTQPVSTQSIERKLSHPPVSLSPSSVWGSEKLVDPLNPSG